MMEYELQNCRYQIFLPFFACINWFCCVLLAFFDGFLMVNMDDLYCQYGEHDEYARQVPVSSAATRRRSRDPENWLVNNRSRQPLKPATPCSCQKKCLFELVSKEETELIQADFAELSRDARRRHLYVNHQNTIKKCKQNTTKPINTRKKMAKISDTYIFWWYFDG